MRNKLPIQPLELDDHNVLRFRENRIVSALLDTSTLDMNALAVMDFTPEERTQFAQLIGYSFSGFGELSYVDDDTYDSAQRMYDENESEEEARLNDLEKKLSDLKFNLKDPIANLYGIHPNDLTGNY